MDLAEFEACKRRAPKWVSAFPVEQLRPYPDWNGDPKTPRYIYTDPETGKEMPLADWEVLIHYGEAHVYAWPAPPATGTY
jgi:hypothetical protein